MAYKSESDVMHTLGIESWRNLSKAHVVQLAAMMPDLDREVALKIIEQLPEFTAFANQVLDNLDKQYDAALDYNRQSQEAVHKSYDDVRRILKSELERDIDFEQRRHIYELLMETAKQEAAKDTENKAFIQGMFNKALKAAAVGLGAVVVFVGGKAVVNELEDRVS